MRIFTSAGVHAAPATSAKTEFSGKPLRIIVPFTVGRSQDIIARALSVPLGDLAE